jgi:hypothetical protein
VREEKPPTRKIQRLNPKGSRTGTQTPAFIVSGNITFRILYIQLTSTCFGQYLSTPGRFNNDMHAKEYRDAAHSQMIYSEIHKI